MKKKFALFISVIFLFFVGWVYQVIKFEQLVKEGYVPLLEHYKENIAYESIEVDKFRFKVTLIKPKLSLKSNILSFVSDRLVFKHLPLMNKVYIDSYGESEKTDMPEDTLYAPNHHVSIAISKPYLNTDFRILKADIENNQFNLFDSRSDMQLLSLDKYNLSFENRENDKDSYTLKISSVSKNTRLGDAFTEFMSVKFLNTFPLPLQLLSNTEQKSSSDYYHFLAKLNEIVGGTDENSDISITYPKAFLREIEDHKAASDGTKLSVFNEIFKKNFDIDVKNKRVNKFINGKFSLKFYNNERSKIEFDVSQDYNHDSVQNSEMMELAADYMQKVANRDLNKFFSGVSEPVVFSQDDFVRLLKPLTNIRDVSSTGLIEYSRDDGEASHQFTAKINNLVLKFKGSGDRTHYSGALNLDNLQDLIKFANSYNVEAIQPTLTKVSDTKMLERFQKIIMTIDKHGLDVLKALSDNGLENQNNFSMNLKKEDDLKSFQINGKEWHQVFEDPRIKIFIKI